MSKRKERVPAGAARGDVTNKCRFSSHQSLRDGGQHQELRQQCAANVAVAAGEPPQCLFTRCRRHVAAPGSQSQIAYFCVGCLVKTSRHAASVVGAPKLEKMCAMIAKTSVPASKTLGGWVALATCELQDEAEGASEALTFIPPEDRPFPQCAFDWNNSCPCCVQVLHVCV